MIHRIRIIILFARDLWTELPAVWAIALSNRCDRDGGHRWAPDPGTCSYFFTPTFQTCERCGSSRTLTPTIANSSTSFVIVNGNS